MANVCLGVHWSTGEQLDPQQAVFQVFSHQPQGAEVSVCRDSAHELLAETVESKLPAITSLTPVNLGFGIGLVHVALEVLKDSVVMIRQGACQPSLVLPGLSRACGYQAPSIGRPSRRRLK